MEPELMDQEAPAPAAPQDRPTITIRGEQRPIIGVASEFVGASDSDLQTAGFQRADNGQWYREEAQSPVEPLDTFYLRRQEQREGAALDQEAADLESAVQAGIGITDSGAAAVARDVGTGLFLEGGQAVISGIKGGVNATIDLVDEMGDWLEERVPLGGIQITNPETGAFQPRYLTPAQLQAQGGGSLPRVSRTEDERPETVTGRAIEGVSQFLTGFAGGGRILRGWRTATRAGQIGKAMVQGALADFAAFDGQEERLSNLLEEIAPEAIAPVFSYLAARPDDGEVEGRLKNTLEGLGLGVAVDAITQSVRALRAARQVRAEARAAARAEGLQVDPTLAATQANAEGEALQTAVRQALGNPDAPRFRVRAAGTVTPEQVLANPAAANVFDINWSRIDADNDFKDVIANMASRFRDDVDLMRRGQRSWDATREASGKVDWVQSMAERRTGQAMNAEEVLAYRQALSSAAQKLGDLSNALILNPTMANQYAFRRMVGIYRSIQGEFMGARAEAGRALNAFRIPAGAPASYLRQVDDLLAQNGGSRVAIDLARAVREAMQNGDENLNQLLRQGWRARTSAIVQTVATNGKLSGPSTALVNVLGAPGAMLLEVASRAVAPRLARAFGGEGSTQVGEAAALLHGMQQAARDMFRLDPMDVSRRISADNFAAIREQGVFRGLAPGIDEAAPRGVPMRAEREEAGMGTPRAISATAFRVNEDTPLGRLLDVVGLIMEAPSNINQLGDDFYKVMSARGEIHAQAFRRVAREGLTGEAAQRRMAETLDDPPDDILEAAERAMHDLTFTRSDGKFERGLSHLRAMIDRGSTQLVGLPIASLVMPFMRTPLNLTSMAVQYSPLAHLSARARNALAAGGAEAEIAKAKIAVGSALWSVWMGMAMDGQITGGGPNNPAQRDALMRTDKSGGNIWQPYSVRFGDRWYSFERLDPFATGLSLVGDLAELIRNDDWNAGNLEEVGEIAANAVIAMGEAFFDKNTLKGAVEFTTALTGNNVAVAERFLGSTASGMLPFSSAMRTARRANDPYLREVVSVVDALKNTIPGMSDDLTVQRDLWGRPRRYYTEQPVDQMVGVLGLQSRGLGGDAIDLEVLNNGVSISMPQRNISVMGENVSLRNRPDIYSELVRLAGDPAREQLSAVAEGRHPDSGYYFSLSDGPEGEKASYIKSVVEAYRRDARAQILDIYAADLQQMAMQEIARREAVRMGE
ncbi:MAG: hypothetical protein ACK5MB_07400 [Phycisphaerales bacterium]|jgi:hypothetical protein